MRRMLMQCLVFTTLNLAAIWLYLSAFSIVSGQKGDLGLAGPHLRIVGLCAPFVMLEFPFFQRAETWKRRIVVLYLGMLGAILGSAAIVSMAWLGLGGIPGALVIGHLIGLPGLCVVSAVNWIVYSKLGVPIGRYVEPYGAQ